MILVNKQCQFVAKSYYLTLMDPTISNGGTTNHMRVFPGHSMMWSGSPGDISFNLCLLNTLFFLLCFVVLRSYS